MALMINSIVNQKCNCLNASIEISQHAINMLFEEKGFVFPVFRCPTRNITTKFPGTQINHFEDPLETTQGYCYNIALAQQTCDNSLEDGGPGCQRLLDPNDESCNAFLRLPPFSTCKNDCPGAGYFGV